MRSDDNNSGNINNNNISKAIDCVPLSSDSSIFTKHRHTSNNNVSSQQNNINDDEVLFDKLEQENARLPPQDSTMFILAQIQRQTALLEKQQQTQQSEEDCQDFSTIHHHHNELKTQLSAVVQLNQKLAEQERQEYLAIWEAVIQDFDRVATMTPHLLSVKLRSGVPDGVRGLVWQAMCKSASLHLETVYGQLCREQSPHERIIKRDLARTFPCIDMFKQENGAGQLAMRRILESYSLYDSEVGYCQGLAFLVGPLLLNMPEQQAFCVFVRLMETYEMRPMFTMNMAGLQLRLYQFTHLLNELLPDLAKHMNKHGVHAAMYASQWFLTLFAYVFPMSLVQRIYDIVFAEGAAETIMRVAIAMLRRSQEKILQETEFEDLLDHVTSRKLIEPYADDDAQVIHDATSLSSIITRTKMDSLADQYQSTKKKSDKTQSQQQQQRFWKRKLKRTPSNGSQRSIDSTASVSSTASSLRRTHSVGGASAAAVMVSSLSNGNGTKYVTLEHHEQEIQKLSWTLAQLNTKHQQTINQLVELKMDKQDVESERDALKMTIIELEKSKQQHRELQSHCALSISSSSSNSIVSNNQVDFAFSENSTLSPVSLASSADEDSTLSNNIIMIDDEQEQLRTELVRLKVENFELQQQVEKQNHEHEDMHVRLDMVNDAQMALVEQLITTKADMDELMKEKKQKDMEWLEVTAENKELREQLAQVKAKASQLMIDHTQMVRRDLVNAMNDKNVNNYDNIAITTANAQQQLFESTTKAKKERLQRRRSTNDLCSKQLMLSGINNDSNYESSTMSDTFLVMRIRELERSLAEVKIRLVEYEANQDQHQDQRPQQQNPSPTSSTVLADKNASSSMHTRTVSRSGSIYGRMWHAITPRSSSTIDRSIPFSSSP